VQRAVHADRDQELDRGGRAGRSGRGQGGGQQPRVSGVTDDGLAAIFSTSGNPDCHVILRGSSAGPNYDRANVEHALGRLAKAGLPGRVIVDGSHGNSGKDHLRQPGVAQDIATRLAAGERGVVGLMLESFLVAGRQELALGKASELTYGQSVTDACMSWDVTVDVLRELAAAVPSGANWSRQPTSNAGAAGRGECRSRRTARDGRPW